MTPKDPDGLGVEAVPSLKESTEGANAAASSVHVKEEAPEVLRVEQRNQQKRAPQAAVNGAGSPAQIGAGHHKEASERARSEQAALMAPAPASSTGKANSDGNGGGSISVPTSSGGGMNGSMAMSEGGTLSHSQGMSPPPHLLRHTSLADEWSEEEQKTLDEALNKFPSSKFGTVQRFVKIAALLPGKTVRDVALRCRWMTKKEMGKRRKGEAESAMKRLNSKKEKAAESPRLGPVMPPRATFPLYPHQMAPMEIVGPIEPKTASQLLEMNLLFVTQIRNNMTGCKVQENSHLLARFRDNIIAILNGMHSVSGVMSHMPPLPVKVNLELANAWLPRPAAPGIPPAPT